MAIYKAGTTPPTSPTRINGQAWQATTPGATIRGWTYPTWHGSAHWRAIDSAARILDRIYPGLPVESRAAWDQLAHDWPYLNECPPEEIPDTVEPLVIPVPPPPTWPNYEFWTVTSGTAAYIVTPWGRCDQATPTITGDWGTIHWFDLGGGQEIVVGQVHAGGTFADWSPPSPGWVSILGVRNHWDASGPILVNTTTLQPGESTDIDWDIGPRPTIINIP